MPSQPDLAGVASTPATGFSYAFQPIVDAASRIVVSYEALIRGPQGESAGRVRARVPADAMHRFDADSRQLAIATAMRLGIACDLNLNFLPQSLVVAPAALDS